MRIHRSLLRPTLVILFALLAFTNFGFPALRAQTSETDSPEIAKIREIETNWAAALVKKDQFALDLALAPTYVDISATGDVSTKNQQIARLFAENYAVLGYNETITSIRVLGDIAIAQGTYTLRRKWASDVQEDRGIFTHIYQRNRATWQCINGQRTIVKEQVGPPKKVEKAGELPFRLPFTGKKEKDDGSTVTMAPPAPAKQAAPAPAQQAAPTPTPDQAGPPVLQDVK
jgi:ketosteroid isomerase-like protein